MLFLSCLVAWFALLLSLGSASKGAGNGILLTPLDYGSYEPPLSAKRQKYFCFFSHRNIHCCRMRLFRVNFYLG